MRTVLALLTLPLLAVCSPSEDRTTEEEQLPDTPEAASEESMNSWTIDVGSGDAAGFQILIDGGDLAITTTAEGHAWRPGDLVMEGDFEVTAVFEPRDEDSAADDQYGIIVGGKNLGDVDQAHTDFMVRPTGEHKIVRHEAGTTKTLIDWKSGPGPMVAPSSPVPPGPSQQLAVHVSGDIVEFLIGGTLVATLARADVQPHGLAGLHVGPNAQVDVSGWDVREPEPQVGRGSTPGDSLPPATP